MVCSCDAQHVGDVTVQLDAYDCADTSDDAGASFSLVFVEQEAGRATGLF